MTPEPENTPTLMALLTAVGLWIVIFALPFAGACGCAIHHVTDTTFDGAGNIEARTTVVQVNVAVVSKQQAAQGVRVRTKGGYEIQVGNAATQDATAQAEAIAWAVKAMLAMP